MPPVSSAFFFRPLVRGLGIVIVVLPLQACLQNSGDQSRTADDPLTFTLDVQVHEPRSSEQLEEDLVVTAATQGDARAQYKLARTHHRAGRKDKAFEWLEKSAQQGLPQAQYYLALMYREGSGVSRDEQQTFIWAKKAAESGHRGAQDFVGEMYTSGLGVERDYVEAAKWYRKSAEAGYVGAATKLAALYYVGKGVPRDLGAAREWAKRDAARAHPDADQLLALIDKAEFRQKGSAPAPKIVVERGLPSKPIPPSAGYSKELEALHNRPMAESAEIVAMLEPKITSLTPPYLYELARRTFDSDRQESFTWYWLGIVRSRYDAARCTDKTSQQGVLYLSRLAPRVAEAMRKNEKLARNAAIAALEREQTFPAGSDPYWICIHGIKASLAAMEKTRLKDWQVAEEQWSGIREKLRKSLQKFAETGFKKR